MRDDAFKPLLALLEKVPAVSLPAGRKSIGCGLGNDGTWWIDGLSGPRFELALEFFEQGRAFIFDGVALASGLFARLRC